MISGLIRKNSLTTKFSNKTFVNSDIIFDTIRKYEPNHIILKITQTILKKHKNNNSLYLKSTNITKKKQLKKPNKNILKQTNLLTSNL